MADLKISQLTGATTPLAGTEVLPIVQSSTTKKVSVADLTAGRNVSVQQLTSRKDQDAVTQMVLSNQFTNANGSGVSYDFYYGTTRLGGLKHAFDNVGAYFDLEVWNGSAPVARQRTYSTGGGVWGTGTDPGAGNYKIENGNLSLGTAAKGINFTANTPAAGMTSQLLNWYEEGTFTPTLVCGSGSVTLDAALTKGAYTRIGRTVTVNLQIALNTISTPSGSLKIGGLPFTSVNAYFGNSAAAIWADGLTSSAVAQIQAHVELNATTISVTRYSAGASVNDVAGYLQGGPSTWTFFRVAATYIAA